MDPWPPWPQFLDDDSELRQGYDRDPEFARVKRHIAGQYGEASLTRAWITACSRLEKVTKEIKERGPRIVPDLQFEDVRRGALTAETIEEIRRVGCFIVRGVISPSEAEAHLGSLKSYVGDNVGRYTGFPKDRPSMYDLFNTPTQNDLRNHPALLELMRWCNTLWEYPNDDPDVSPEPVMYADGFRIREPGTNFLGLGPHIDAGGLARWGSPSYERVYVTIFSGHPERFNPYDISTRKDANQAFYGGRHPSTVLRAFQGWTALSRNAPREGNILLYPMVKYVLPYVLIRPFFRPPTDPARLLDAAAWTFDGDSPWFPGTSKELGQLLSPSSHPHLHLEQCLLRIPTINAGDTVWWHSDMCHAVDPEHIGEDVASVVYIAAVPSTKISRAYGREQYDRMVKGLPPQDFAYGIDESKLKGFEGFKGQYDYFKHLSGSRCDPEDEARAKQY